PVDPELIAALERLVSCEDLTDAGEAAALTISEPVAEGAISVAPALEGDITDDEFEQLLDAISDDSPLASLPKTASASDEISEDEFEALLDQLHGPGKGPGAKSSPARPVAPVEIPAASSSAGDDITDDEFEALLDQLHGKGKAPSKATVDKSIAAESSAPASP